jgi:hypothetical protein
MFSVHTFIANFCFRSCKIKSIASIPTKKLLFLVSNKFCVLVLVPVIMSTVSLLTDIHVAVTQSTLLTPDILHRVSRKFFFFLKRLFSDFFILKKYFKKKVDLPVRVGCHVSKNSTVSLPREHLLVN